MIYCAYCGEPATRRIPSNPEEVCFEHALEFWTGLLVTRDRSEGCVKHEPLCACQSCEELTASYLRAVAIAAAAEEWSASYRRSLAIAAAGPSPADQDGLLIRLAS
jgi:hypothetical protein